MITIGVLGLHRHVGTTHISMLLAEYLSCYRRKRTALVELSEHTALEELERVWYGQSRAERLFWKKRCSYWKRAGWEVLQEVKEYRTEYCILDLGSDFERSAEHLLACNKKIIVGECGILSEKEWEHFFTRPRMQHTICLTGRKEWTLLQNHGVTGKKGKITAVTQKMQLSTIELGAEPVFPVSRRIARLLKQIV